jgi:hypothetical protein
MKTTWTSGLLPMILIGCSTYQYAVVDTNIRTDDRGQIVAENDSVRVTYKFAGMNGPAVVELYNKLNIPLYVNWQRSSVIIDDRSISRASEVSTLNATAVGTQVQWPNYTPTDTQVSSSYHSIDGSLAHTPHVAFVPPRAFIESAPITLTSGFLLVDHKSADIEHENGMQVKYKTFDNDDSPFRFRSFITLSYTPDFAKPMIFDQEFWVDEVALTQLKPSEMTHYKGRQDVFHASKPNGIGFFGGSVAMVALVVLMAAVE